MSQYRSENHSVNSATEPLGLKTDSKTKNRLAFKVIKKSVILTVKLFYHFVCFEMHAV